MRRLTFLCLLVFNTLWSTGQKIYCVSWLDWTREPDYPEKDGIYLVRIDKEPTAVKIIKQSIR